MFLVTMSLVFRRANPKPSSNQQVQSATDELEIREANCAALEKQVQASYFP